MYITKKTLSKTIHIDLLQIVDEDNNGHSIYIEDFENEWEVVESIKGIIVSIVCQNLHHMKGYAVTTNWVAMM